MLVPGVVLENYFSKTIINGALHWSGVIMKKRVLRNIIISFGIRDEASRYIKLLDIDFDGTKWNPFVRMKLLAIVICTRDRHTFNIWVMNEYGIKESWTKQLSVGPLCVHRMVGCGRMKGFLIFFY